MFASILRFSVLLSSTLAKAALASARSFSVSSAFKAFKSFVVGTSATAAAEPLAVLAFGAIVKPHRASSQQQAEITAWSRLAKGYGDMIV